MPTRIKLTLEYDGTDFHGWQVQDRADGSGVRTVQGEVERALARLTGQPVRIAGAGRTDEGVHALGQVATFDLPDGCSITVEQLKQGMNANLPPDIAALKAEAMPDDFHAMASASGKIYRYLILNRAQRSATALRTHWHVRFELDVNQMRAAAAHFIGTHDYTAFATTLADIQSRRLEDGKSELETVREISRVEVTSRGGYAELSGAEIVIEVHGSGFLYKMVRTMVGSLVEVGRGKQPPDWIGRVLASKDRRLAGPTAPAKGLYLAEALFR